jgi:hypothetical protein
LTLFEDSARGQQRKGERMPRGRIHFRPDAATKSVGSPEHSDLVCEEKSQLGSKADGVELTPPEDPDSLSLHNKKRMS